MAERNSSGHGRPGHCRMLVLHSTHGLFYSFSSIWGSSLWNGAIQHLGQVFSSQLIPSESSLTDLPRGVIG